jgi:hypothetical protein
MRLSALAIVLTCLAGVPEGHAGCDDDAEPVACSIDGQPGTKECVNGKWGPCVLDDSAPSPQAPRPPTGLAATHRTHTALQLRWDDQATNERSYEVLRSDARHHGPWVVVATVGAGEGRGTLRYYTDTGLHPDTVYCYQVNAVNEHGIGASPQSCVYTRDGDATKDTFYDYPVWRAQIILHTSNRVGQPGYDTVDTEDAVFVSLNGDAGAAPSGNWTWLDYSRDDFQRGDTFAYDLNLDTLEYVSDITQIVVGKEGDDGWCLADLVLEVNGFPVYSQTFRNPFGGSDCHWLDTQEGYSTRVIVSHAMLRAHPDWAAYNHLGAELLLGTNGLRHAELVSRVEAYTGDLLHGTEGYWGQHSGAAVEVTRGCDAPTCQTIHVQLALAADVPALPDPAVSIDFDLHFVCFKGELSIVSSHEDIQADSHPAVVAMSLGLIKLLDKQVEKGMRAAWEGIDKPLKAGKNCHFEVQHNGDVILSPVDDPDPGPDPEPDPDDDPEPDPSPCDRGSDPHPARFRRDC